MKKKDFHQVTRRDLPKIGSAPHIITYSDTESLVKRKGGAETEKKSDLKNEVKPGRR